MTTFQKQINARPAKGVPGDKAGLNPHVYTIGNPVADGPVTVGGFVWDGAESGQAKSTGTGAPLGFVERVLAYYDLNQPDASGLTVPAGSPLLVARRGDYYAVASTAAKRFSPFWRAAVLKPERPAPASAALWKPAGASWKAARPAKSSPSAIGVKHHEIEHPPSRAVRLQLRPSLPRLAQP